jgi:O-methyltransferase domain/Dimerisation domain
VANPEERSTAKRETAGLPPGVLLYQLGIGHYVSRALFVAAKLGLADLMTDGPRDPRDLASASGTHMASLKRLLRLLTSVGVFEEREDGRFSLAPLGELLRSDTPGSMRASVMLFTGVGIQDSWKELEYCVRTGEPAFRRTSPDADPFTSMAQDPEAAALFDKAMATFAPQTAAAVAAAYDFSALRTLADVGGGNGSLLLGILKANPGLRGIVFDQPHVAARAREQVEAAGMADRCEVVGGSFFEKVPSGADAYLLKHVIHDWNDERAAAILRNCRAAMTSTARLLLVEGVYPARIDQSLESRGAAANDVNMLVCTGGRQRSDAEFRDLFAASGFRLERVVPTPARVCVIEALPAG